MLNIFSCLSLREFSILSMILRAVWELVGFKMTFSCLKILNFMFSSKLDGFSQKFSKTRVSVPTKNEFFNHWSWIESQKFKFYKLWNFLYKCTKMRFEPQIPIASTKSFLHYGNKNSKEISNRWRKIDTLCTDI